jgi:DNA-binding transcriptional MocR family regulator
VAVRRGVAFVPGPFFFSAGGAASPGAVRGLRLSYSALSADKLRRGVELLSEALQAVGRGQRVEQVVY